MHRRVKGRPLLLEQVAQVSDISVGVHPRQPCSSVSTVLTVFARAGF